MNSIAGQIVPKNGSRISASAVPGGRKAAPDATEGRVRVEGDLTRTAARGQATTLSLPDRTAAGLNDRVREDVSTAVNGFHARATVRETYEKNKRAPRHADDATVLFQTTKEMAIENCKGAQGVSSSEDACWGLRRDGRVAERANAIMDRLTRNTAEPYPVEVLEQQSNDVNASSLGAGKITVSEKLAATHDDDMLAFVLAHELAHDRHNDSRSGAKSAEVIDAVLDDPAVPASAKQETLSELNTLQHEQELAADVAGVRLMAKAGFDPRAALRSIDRMEKNAGQQHGASHDESTGSHPAWSTRRAAVLRVIETEGLDAVYQQNRPR